MALDLSIFRDDAKLTGQKLDEAFIDWLVHEASTDQILHCEMLWGYYRNQMQEINAINPFLNSVSSSSRPYRQKQEYGLPNRITGYHNHLYGGITGGIANDENQRKEVVIENDIAWRIDTMVDFLFGKQILITSRVDDHKRAEQIECLLNSVFENNGGISFFQEMALLGSVYGFVDIILRLKSTSSHLQGGSSSSAGGGSKPFSDVLEEASQIVLETIEAPRSLPILDENDCRTLNFYIQHYWQLHSQLDDGSSSNEIVQVNRHGREMQKQKETHRIEIIGSSYWQRYENNELIGSGTNPLGIVPVVHIQNMPLPNHYEGQSDVEPLIPLQDELNTRLSDRANRITFQSFKMYLGKGIEGFEDRLVSPGQMWSSFNPDATIEEFGGDSVCPSEESHIEHVREAIDKASGVASVAAGILKGRVGNLTSAVALKVTLMGVLAKTERKRVSYGRGIQEMCRMILLALDKTGIFPNEAHERNVDITWESPLPENVMEKLQEADMKKQLGISQDVIMKELGY